MSIKRKKKENNKLNKLEIYFQEILKKLNFKYKTQVIYKRKIFDFLLVDYNIFIEVDGDFFHCNESIGYTPIYNHQKRNIKNDAYKNKIIKNSRKYTLIRFWENDIMNNTNSVINKLLIIKKRNNIHKNKKIRNKT